MILTSEPFEALSPVTDPPFELATHAVTAACLGEILAAEPSAVTGISKPKIKTTG